MISSRSLIFVKKKTFRKILSGIPSECQTVRIQIRPDVLSGLIWVQIVCRDYQLTTKDVSGRLRGNPCHQIKTKQTSWPDLIHKWRMKVFETMTRTAGLSDPVLGVMIQIEYSGKNLSE